MSGYSCFESDCCLITGRVAFESPILLDLSRLLWRTWRGQLPTGIDRLCLAYAERYRGVALAMIQRGGLTRVLPADTSRQLFDLLLDPPIDFKRRVVALLARAAFGPRVPPKSLRSALYLNVGHTGLDHAGHGCWVRRSEVRAVYYVHDLIPITHPQFARAGQPERHAARMSMVLRHATAVLANSEDSIATFADFARQEGLPMPPALCAALAGTPLQLEVDPSRPISKPYFVTVGTIEGRKNHLLLLRVWRRLIERLGARTPPLIIIGQRGWCADEVLRQLDRDPALRGHVTEMGCCDDAKLQRYLVHAQALLFPSFVEGQGLPLIEALAVRTPVIASDLAVFRETAGLIPDFLDPTDEDAWLDMILRHCVPEGPERAAQVARMDGFHVPTWDEHFSKVENWLLDLDLPLA